MTHALRYSKQSSNTGDKLNSILSTIGDPNVEQVILFATPVEPSLGYSESDGAETNLPEVAALAIGTFAGAKVAAIFDGAFLCAARIPRYLEVRVLLDAAVSSGKVYFAKHRAPFTSKENDADALAILLNLGPFEQLTTSSRSRYFSLISNMTEAALQQL